jgi:hypothetical protein
VRDNTVNNYLSNVEQHDNNTIVKEYILQYDNIHETINENINQNKDIQKYLENIANEIFMQEKAYTLIKESPKFDNIAEIPYISSYESTYNDNYINIKINMEYLPPVEKKPRYCLGKYDKRHIYLFGRKWNISFRYTPR